MITSTNPAPTGNLVSTLKKVYTRPDGGMTGGAQVELYEFIMGAPGHRVGHIYTVFVSNTNGGYAKSYISKDGAEKGFAQACDRGMI